MNLRSGRKLYGQMLILNFWTNFHQKQYQGINLSYYCGQLTWILRHFM
jgi:hypothetical protein